LAEQTGFSSEDLELFWHALIHMWDLDRSASRGMMACRGLYVFSHESPLGDAPAHRLFETIAIQRATETPAPRAFSDYQVTIDEELIPNRVTLTRLEG
jgi:CRISPR-associated protein Csd2